MCTERREAPRDVKADGRRMLRRKDGIGDVSEMQSNGSGGGWGGGGTAGTWRMCHRTDPGQIPRQHDGGLIRSGTDKRTLPATNTESVFN